MNENRARRPRVAFLIFAAVMRESSNNRKLCRARG